jgi:putative nucleotidyltransferase with HDIG domain
MGINNNYQNRIDELTCELELASNELCFQNKEKEKRAAELLILQHTLKMKFAKSNRELKHSKVVSNLCEKMSIKMGFDAEAVKRIKLAGLMHDIGKIGIDDKILNKNGKLTNKEYELIKRHPEIGFRILNSVQDLAVISKYVLEHHEKWDGSGYPQGLKGEEIKIEARIISVVGAYAAMTNVRAFGKVLSRDEAILEIKRGSGTHFDPTIVKIFINEVAQNFKTV